MATFDEFVNNVLRPSASHDASSIHDPDNFSACGGDVLVIPSIGRHLFLGIGDLAEVLPYLGGDVKGRDSMHMCYLRDMDGSEPYTIFSTNTNALRSASLIINRMLNIYPSFMTERAMADPLNRLENALASLSQSMTPNSLTGISNLVMLLRNDLCSRNGVEPLADDEMMARLVLFDLGMGYAMKVTLPKAIKDAGLTDNPSWQQATASYDDLVKVCRDGRYTIGISPALRYATLIPIVNPFATDSDVGVFLTDTPRDLQALLSLDGEMHGKTILYRGKETEEAYLLERVGNTMICQDIRSPSQLRNYLRGDSGCDGGA